MFYHCKFKSLYALCSIIFVMLMLQSSVSAQQTGPEYKGVAYDSDGNPLGNATLKVEFRVKENDASGTAVYAEQHQITTNVSGQFILSVGTGEARLGDFSLLDPLSYSYFLSVGIDYDGTGNFLQAEVRSIDW